MTAGLAFLGINLSTQALALRKQSENIQGELENLEMALANAKGITFARRMLALVVCVALRAQIRKIEQLIQELK